MHSLGTTPPCRVGVRIRVQIVQIWTQPSRKIRIQTEPKNDAGSDPLENTDLFWIQL